MLRIKGIPKDLLFYEFWLAARSISFPRQHLQPEHVEFELSVTLCTQGRLRFDVFKGKRLCFDITDDTMDVFEYNYYNGHNLAQMVVTKIIWSSFCKLSSFSPLWNSGSC